MFFRKSRKLRFDGRRAPLPQVGQIAAQLGVELLESRQLLTASPLTGDFGDLADASLADPNHANAAMLPAAGSVTIVHQNSASSSPSASSGVHGPSANLEITKSDDLGGSSIDGAVGTAVPGDEIAYFIVVTNLGPSDVTGASIVDLLPDTLSGATFTAAATDNVTGFTANGSGSIDDTDVDMPAGSTLTYALQATVASSATGTLSNTATVAAPEGVTDNDPGNNSATDTDNLTLPPGLEIIKTDNDGGSSASGAVGTAVPGQLITYTIVVSNGGPDDVFDAAVVDTLPDALDSGAYTATGTGGASGFTESGSGSIDDKAVDLPAGSTVTYTLQSYILPSAFGTLSNTATVTPPPVVTDDELSGDDESDDGSVSATDTDTLAPQADLLITKSDNLGGSSVGGVIGTALPGQAITYTIVVSNDGPSDVRCASIFDSLSSMFWGATYTATQTGGANGFTSDGSGDIDDDAVNLPSGSTVTYTLQATIDSDASGWLSNTASVTPPGEVTNTGADDFGDDESEDTSSSATDTDELAEPTGLQITKSDNFGGSSTGTIGTAVPGQGITYTIVVTNDGSSDLSGATISDSLSDLLSGATFTATQTGGAGGFTASGSGDIDDEDVNLPIGSTVTYTLQATIASSATGTLSNTASVTEPSVEIGAEEFDDQFFGDDESDLEDVSATDTDTLAPEADLEIVKSDNLGGSSDDDVWGSAVPGAPITYTIVVTNNGPSDVTGASIVDSLPGILSGATFTATQDGGASGFSASGSGGIDDEAVNLPSGSSVTYTLQATIASSATGTFSNSATVTPPDDVTNTGANDFDDDDDDDESEDTSSIATDNDTLTPQADLEISKSDNLGGSSEDGVWGSAVPGQGITYTIVVTNSGPSDVTGASIVDSLPDILSGATFTATQSGGASGFSASGTGGIDDEEVNLPTGSSVTYTLQATIASSATGSLSNTASVTAPSVEVGNDEFDDQFFGDDDSDLEDVSATDTDALTPEADLKIAKSDNLGGSSAGEVIGTAVPGQGITYTIVVTNNGPSDAVGASVIDTLSNLLSGATYTATATGGATGFTTSGSGSIDDEAVNLPAGSSVTYTLQATIASSATGTMSNVATVTPPDGVINIGGDDFGGQDLEDTISSATDSDTLTPHAVLEITKSDNLGGSSVGEAIGTAVPGHAIIYTIIVSNTGPSDSTGASVVDALSNLLSGAIYTATPTGGATGFTASGSGNIDDAGLNLPAGSTVTYTVLASIVPSATGTLSNTAILTPPVVETDTEDDDLIAAIDTDKLTPHANLGITKTDNFGGSSVTGTSGTAVPGQAITYTIVVSNTGPSDATGVSVVDALPGSLTGATYTAVATGSATGFTASGSGSIDDTAVSIPVGSTITYTVHATIKSSATGTQSNAATLIAPAGVDTNSKTSATDTDTLTPEADLEVAKSDSLGGSSAGDVIGTAVPGQGITYTIVVTNNGPSDVTGASIVDSLPGILGGATFTATQIGGVTGFSTSGSGGIDDRAVNLPAGSTVTYTLHATIASAATGTMTNVATVTPPAGVINTGGDAFGDEESEDKISSATDSDRLSPGANLTITKTDNLGGSSATGAVGTAVPGQTITYTIVVSNTGPSDATGVSVIDALPGVLTGATYTATATGNATGFTASGSGNIDDTSVSVPVGSTVTYTIHVTVVSSATGTLSNTAALTAPAGVDTNSKTSATDIDTLTPQANLTIAKTDSLGGSSATGAVGTAVPGQAITYTIVVSNTGPSDATGVSVVDVLPGMLTGATYTATATGNATGFTAGGSGNIDDTSVSVPVGSTVTYTIHATVVSSATGTLSNPAALTAPAGVDTNSKTSATDIDTLTPQANLTIAKSDNLGGSSATGAVGTAVPGQAITYTIVVSNTGPSDATGVSVIDTLPGMLTGATYTATATGIATGFTASGSGSLDDTAVSIPAGSTITYTVRATIKSSATGTLSNAASLTAPAGVDTNSKTSATDTDTLTPQANLTIAKNDNLGGSSATGAVGTAVPGQAITYTIVVSNTGPSDATGVSVVDVLPGMLTGATYTATATGIATGFTASDSGSLDDTAVSIPAGSTITYTVHATIKSSATGTLSNAASLTAPAGVDTNSKTSATDSDTLTPEADLEITNSDSWGASSVFGSTGAAIPGRSITYTIVVSNNGPSDVTGATVADTPAGILSGVTFTATETGGASGFTASGSGSIDDTALDLPAGSTVTYTIQAIIASSATGTLSNTATVTPPAGVINTGGEAFSAAFVAANFGVPEIAINNSGSSSATVTDTLTPEDDLEITKSDNVGGSSATGVSGVAVPGRSITYTIVVSNAGPSDATDASVFDTLSDLLSGATYTATQTGGATGFTASGSGDIDDESVNLPAGSAVTYTVQATIASSATGTLSNTATLTPDSDDDDDDDDDDPLSATDTDTLAPQADLEITKTDNLGGSSATGAIGTAVPGQGITYTIVVANDGPSDVTGASIADTLSGLLSGATYTAVDSGDATGFTGIGTGSIDDTNVNMPAGSTITYTVHATVVSSATGSLSNTATVTPPAGVTNTHGRQIIDDVAIEGNSSPDIPAVASSSAIDTDTLAPQADLEITKSDNLGGSSATGAVGTAVPGQGITYTIVVSNTGPSDVTGTSVVDTLSSLLSGATYTATQTGGATGFTAGGAGNIDDTGLSLPVGSTITYTVHATIKSSATGTLSNAATLAAPAGLDTNLETSATDSDTLTPQADLEITKSDNLGGSSATGAIGTAVPGQGITYTIVVSNTGPSDATGTSVVDTLSSLLSGATYTATQTGGASGFTAGGSGSIDDTGLSLPVGSTITYTVHATIKSSATGMLSNTAALTAPAGLDTNLKTSATDSDTLSPQADLEITKTDNLGGSSATGAVGTAVPGQGITYTIVVSNTGPSDATGTSVVDTLSSLLSGTTYTATQTGGATGFTAGGSGSIDDTGLSLPVGSTITYTVHATIKSSATGTLSNTAALTAPAGLDTNLETSATDSDTLTPQADLEITKSDNLGGSSATGAIGTAVPGQGITYTIVVSNTGPSDATGTSVVDTLSSLLSGATYTAAQTGGATGFTAGGSGNIDDDAVNLPAGSTITYTVHATIKSSATGTLSNTAALTAPAGLDTNLKTSAIDSDTLSPQADLEITKSDNLGGSSVGGSVGTAIPGQTITYTIVVSNTGPSDATGASVVDSLPSTLSAATFTATATGGAIGFTQSGSGSIDDSDVDLPAGSTITYTVHATVIASATGTLSNTATVTAPDAATVDAALITGLDIPDDIAVSGDDLFVLDFDTNSIAEYTTAGMLVNSALVTGLDRPSGLAISGGNIFVTNGLLGQVGYVSEYTLAGALVNASLVTGLMAPGSIAVSDGKLFVANSIESSGGSGLTGVVGEYDATTGATINATLLTGVNGSIAVSGSNLFVAQGNRISEYTTAGVIVNASLVTGLVDDSGFATSGRRLAVSGDRLFVLDGSSIGEYTTDGETVNSALVTGLTNPTALALSGGNLFVTNVPIVAQSALAGTPPPDVASIGKYSIVTESATDTDTLAPQADLEVTQTDNLGGSSVGGVVGTAVPGLGITYTVVVTNHGSSDARGASIVDSLVNTLKGATYTATATGGATGFTASGTGSIDDVDVDLPAGSTITYTIQATIASSATGTLSNPATVTAPAGVKDPNTANNLATDTDTLAPEADLGITNTDNLAGSSITGATGTAVPGEGITYTIVVTNDGPSDVTGATINDALSNLLSGATYTATATGGATGFTASGSGSINDTAVNLPVGSTVTYTIQATIVSSATGTLSNTATVTPPAGVIDTHQGGLIIANALGGVHKAAVAEVGNSSAADTDILKPEADLEVTKSDNLGGSSVTGSIGAAVPGQAITYTIVVTNAGPSDATGASLIDTLPGSLTGATFTAVGSGGASGFTIDGIGSIADTGLTIPAGGTITYTVHATIVSAATGTLSSTTTVTAPAGVTSTNTGVIIATVNDQITVGISSAQGTNLTSIDFTVSALQTGNLTVTGSYAPPPTPHTSLPISQTQSQPQSQPPPVDSTPVDLTPDAVDDFMSIGAGGGDVDLVGPEMDIDLTKVDVGPSPLLELLGEPRTEDWASDELIHRVLERLADFDELSLVSFEFGDDIVTPATRKTQRVTAAKPVMLQSEPATPTLNTRGSSAAPELNGQPAGVQSGGGQQGTGQGNGGPPANDGSQNEKSGGATGEAAPAASESTPGAATELVPAESSTQNATHGWGWWIGWGVSASTVGTLGWVYGWRRRGRRTSLRQPQKH